MEETLFGLPVDVEKEAIAGTPVACNKLPKKKIKN
jgi:hypothetical protein